MLSSHENPTNYSNNERHERMRKQITVKKRKKGKKMIFLKTNKNTTLQRKVSTPQSFKRKIQLILKISHE